MCNNEEKSFTYDSDIKIKLTDKPTIKEDGIPLDPKFTTLKFNPFHIPSHQSHSQIAMFKNNLKE